MINWHVFAIGKPKLDFARAGIEEYAWRLKPFAQISVHYLKASARDAGSAALLQRSEGMLRVVLDERGDLVTSRALSIRVTKFEQRKDRDVALLVAGADGHSDAVRAAGDWVWSLSKLTLQHEIALAVALEQIYRAYTIKAGLPYHRD